MRNARKFKRHYHGESDAGDLEEMLRLETLVRAKIRAAGVYGMEVEVIDGDREKVGERGAAYKLTLVREGQPPRIIEPGTRRRPFVWDYNLDEGVVFVGPEGRHLAIVLGTAQRSFEGDRHSYMSNAVKLPDGW